MGFTLELQDFSVFPNQSVWSPHQQVEDKNHMIISIDGETTFDKIQYIFKNSPDSRHRGNILNIIKDIYDKPIANIICSGEKLKAFSLR